MQCHDCHDVLLADHCCCCIVCQGMQSLPAALHACWWLAPAPDWHAAVPLPAQPACRVNTRGLDYLHTEPHLQRLWSNVPDCDCRGRRFVRTAESAFAAVRVAALQVLLPCNCCTALSTGCLESTCTAVRTLGCCSCHVSGDTSAIDQGMCLYELPEPWQS